MTLLTLPAAGVPARAAEAPERSAALDAVKGLLVLLMVLYHWLNYFVVREGEIYRYIRFITPSFVFIAGLLVTGVYLARYRIGDPRLHARLAVLGLKLLVLFTALNLAANLVLRSNYNGAELGLSHFLAIAPAVYLAGDGSGAAFEVLVPIGYLLVAAAGLLWGCRLHRHFLGALWLLFVAGVFVLKGLGLGSVNFELLSHGVLGMVLGAFGLDAVERAARPAAAWLATYALYLVVLNVFDVRYEVQVVGLVLNLALLHMAATRLGDTGAVARTVIRLGRYSLFAYIVHIVILQVLARLTGPLGAGAEVVVPALIAALLLTVLTVEVTHVLRRRSALLDRCYRFVFA